MSPSENGRMKTSQFRSEIDLLRRINMLSKVNVNCQSVKFSANHFVRFENNDTISKQRNVKERSIKQFRFDLRCCTRIYLKMSKKHVTNFRGASLYTPDGKIHVKDEPQTPIEEDFGDHNQLDLPFENGFGSMRKSMSMSDITAMRDHLDCSRDNIYHRHRRPTGQIQELSRTKFVSMAEAIYHYQRDTPGRFHSTRPQIFRSQGASGRLGLTIPQSPMLRSKSRSRPQHILSQQEKEALELEELKKFKIKAQPIPKSILDGPIHLPEVSKKPITIPEPFNLTEIQKKLADIKSPNQAVKFKARPAPRHILEKPHVPVKPAISVTKPVSPKFHYKRPQELVKNKTDQHQKEPEKPQRQGPVRPEPFSFEKHDEERKKRKEERIRRQIEEEKKQASSFKACPLPGGVRKRMQCTTIKGSSSTTSSASDNKENHIKFEARPPVVLYKQPFKPVLQQVQLVKPMPFELTSAKRAAEREKFDKQLKEKEEEMERLRQERDKQQEIAEGIAQTELRAKLVHHAKPVPTYTAFIPDKSIAPITVPETPKFVRRLRQN